MQKVDVILKNALIVTMDQDERVLEDGAIAIRGDSIQAVGESKEITAEYKAEETIDCTGKTITPGLVNSHTHASMTLLRGLADDLRLDVWLLGYMMPVEREFVSPEFCRLGTLLGCAEMIRGGTTCFADMYYYEESVAEAAAEAGMRAICGQTVLKFPSPDAESYEDALAYARSYIEKWKDHPFVIPAIAPHAPYTTTEDILKACTELALEYDVPLLTHIAETLEEVENWRETYDMPVVPWVKKLGLLDAKVVAAHCVHIDDGEIHTLEHSGTGVSHNPSSNLKLASGFAPVAEMLETGLNVGVATDGPSSNNDLDMWEEMRLASFIAKAYGENPTALPAKTVFDMATRMGAKAVYLGDITGSLEAGKRADIIMLDLESVHNAPHFARSPDAVYSRLVYTAKAMDVTDVMIDGKWVLRERQLKTIDLEPLLKQAADYAAKIDSFLIEREGSVLSKLIAIGGAEQEESYEIQIKVRIPDAAPFVEKLNSGEFEIVRTAHYLEYDTYFSFDAPEVNRLRYREDEFVNDDGEVFNVRYRLTLTGPAAEGEYHDAIFLSRSRFIAPAIHSLRFYQEYFNPASSIEVNKDRLRWLLRYEGVELFVNIDRLINPKSDCCFLEIKSRTWSRRDAQQKADKISKLIHALGARDADTVRMEYPELVSE
jgi:5-methylthioadenosine/S-adenosylhomocysteine deaminase